MNNHSHLSLVVKVLFHAAIAFTAKLTFFFGFSLSSINIILSNILMITGLSIIAVSGYHLCKGHPKFMHVRLFMLALLFIFFIGMLFEANGILF